MTLTILDLRAKVGARKKGEPLTDEQKADILARFTGPDRLKRVRSSIDLVARAYGVSHNTIGAILWPNRNGNGKAKPRVRKPPCSQGIGGLLLTWGRPPELEP